MPFNTRLHLKVPMDVQEVLRYCWLVSKSQVAGVGRHGIWGALLPARPCVEYLDCGVFTDMPRLTDTSKTAFLGGETCWGRP